MTKQVLKRLAKNFVRHQKFSFFFRLYKMSLGFFILSTIVGDVPLSAGVTTSPTTPSDASEEDGRLPSKQVRMKET